MPLAWVFPGDLPARVAAVTSLSLVLFYSIDLISWRVFKFLENNKAWIWDLFLFDSVAVTNIMTKK